MIDSNPPTPDAPDSQIFRQEAIEHYLRETEGKAILRVSPPWTWMLIVIAGSFVGISLLFAVLGKAEVSQRGKGILRPQAGVRSLHAEVSGTVLQVLAPVGAYVKAGDPILRINSVQLVGSQLEADRAFQSRAQGMMPIERFQTNLHVEQLQTVRDKIQRLEENTLSMRTAVERAQKRVDAGRELRKDGIIGVLELNSYEDQFDSACRSLSNHLLEIRQARQELTSLETQRQEKIWNQRNDTDQARARREAVEMSLRQATVTAPIDGLVEGVVLRPGDQVQAGTLVAKIIPITKPEKDPLIALAFIPEKDRAWVKSGDSVALEIAQYPFSEFGTLKGIVRRVGDDLASANELQEAFGPTPSEKSDPSFRVEIVLQAPLPGTPLASMPLRSGMLCDVRFTLRRRSLASFAIEPLRRWLD